MSITNIKTNISLHEKQISELQYKIKQTELLVKGLNTKFYDRKRIYSVEPYDSTEIKPRIDISSIKVV